MALVSIMLSGAVVHGGEALASGLRLDRSPDKVTALSIAKANRPAPEASISVHTRWRMTGTADGVRTWETRNPIRPRTLFFHRAPRGMKLQRQRAEGRAKGLKIAAEFDDAGKSDTWAFSTHSIKVRRPVEDGAPEPGEYVLRYPKAQERERELNREMASAADDRSFTFRSVQVDDTCRHGLFLPAPSNISFQVPVPDNGLLSFDARIIPPEVALEDQQSDGAEVVVIVNDTEVRQISVSAQVHTHDIDLAEYGGQTVSLTLATRPGASDLLDYVFLAEPVIRVADPDPPRVIIVFIDTLRPDHMSLYGYERPTSPRLDAWASDAAVFTQARSIAPWTLPSARTMLTGAHPERWDKVPRLQDRFANAGWATALIAGNVYLSSNFEMADGWGTHRCINWPQASVQVDRALSNGTQSADFSTRPHAFGRPLYGLRQWGSLKNGKKYVVNQGKESIFDITADPGETRNVFADTDVEPLRTAMSEALDRPVVPGWLIVPSKRREGAPVRVTLHTPVRAAWPGEDPTHSGRASVDITPDKLVARWPKQRGRVEAFVVPGELDSDEPISVEVKIGKTIKTETLDLSATAKPGRPARYLRTKAVGRSVEITSPVVPIPTEADGAIEGFDPEVAGDLESLGYVGD